MRQAILLARRSDRSAWHRLEENSNSNYDYNCANKQSLPVENNHFA
jgi:hypothetical protein